MFGIPVKILLSPYLALALVIYAYVDGGLPTETGAPAASPGAPEAPRPIVEKNARALNIEVYVTSWCPYCRRLETFLKSNSIPYKRFDIEGSRDARQRYLELGGGGIPIIKIGSDVIRGFDEGELRELLEMH